MMRKILREVAVKICEFMKIDVVDEYGAESFSQEGEDMLLRYYFPNKTNGFYVDIGAHHPKRFSNTYYFYKKGWRGINIDAMPGSMAEFAKVRNRDINIEAPIADEPQILTYYMFNEPALNGFSKQISASRNGVQTYTIIDEIKLETKTLAALLDKHLPSGTIIDILSVDTEGFDLSVLKSNNWGKYRPHYIIVEDLELKSLADVSESKVCQFLEKHGYLLIGKCVNSLVFKISPPATP